MDVRYHVSKVVTSVTTQVTRESPHGCKLYAWSGTLAAMLSGVCVKPQDRTPRCIKSLPCLTVTGPSPGNW